MEARIQIKSVVVHRVVDIGRCSKCEFFEWKCASVPLQMRHIWQEALAKHHLIQIKQKQCYTADRARAAAEPPNERIVLGSPF